MDISVFSERLTQARQKKKLNFKELSKISGITATAISYYEKGTKVPQLDSASKLAVALGVSLDWLCGIENDVTNSNDNVSILNSLILCLDKFPNTINTNNDIMELDFIFSLSDDAITNFIYEFNSIKRLKQTSDVFTGEMYNTLISALIKKYQDKALCKTLYDEFVDIPDDEDLPF